MGGDAAVKRRKPTSWSGASQAQSCTRRCKFGSGRAPSPKGGGARGVVADRECRNVPRRHLDANRARGMVGPTMRDKEGVLLLALPVDGTERFGCVLPPSAAIQPERMLGSVPARSFFLAEWSAAFVEELEW